MQHLIRLISTLLVLLCVSGPPALAQTQLPYSPTPLIKLTGSATAQNDLAVPTTDCSRFRVVSVQLLGTWTGTVTFEVSNDGTNWVGVVLTASTATTIGATTATANGTYSGSINANYFRARFSTASSGTVNGTALFFTTSASSGGSAGGPSALSRSCNTNTLLSSSGADAPVPASLGTTGSLTANLVRCVRVTMSCTGTFTGLGWRVIGGVATCGDGNNNCMCGVAVYNSAGTTLIVQSSATETCQTNNTNHTTTGLAATTLAAGTEYLMCYGGSGGSVTFAGTATAFNPFGGATGLIVDSQNAAANKVQYNSDCSAAATPNACCSGDNAGTCTGFPATLGTVTAATNNTFAYIAAQP